MKYKVHCKECGIITDDYLNTNLALKKAIDHNKLGEEHFASLNGIGAPSLEVSDIQSNLSAPENVRYIVMCNKCGLIASNIINENEAYNISSAHNQTNWGHISEPTTIHGKRNQRVSIHI